MHSISLEVILLIGSGLILFSLLLSRLFDNLGMPTMLLFMAVGVAAGQSGLGFSGVEWARGIGIVAMIFILFSGGLETDWREVRPVFRLALSLSTIGIVLTSALCGLFLHYVCGFPIEISFLVGAIVSSTDAAALFSLMRSRHFFLRSGVKPLLELESGTNDPMAIFLTIALMAVVKHTESHYSNFVWMFLKQAIFGTGIGVLTGWATKELANRLRFSVDGLLSVFVVGMIFFGYAVTDRIGGSGFLAVYIAGIIAGNSPMVQKKTLTRFWDSLAWLSQIVMFLTLGLFLKLHILKQALIPGLLLSAFLMIVARPAAVFTSLPFGGLSLKAKLFVSWVGVRGAVPLILTTFPLTERLPMADLIFHIVFVVVMLSALLQGWSILTAARVLGLLEKSEAKRKSPIEFQGVEGWDGEIVDQIVPFNSPLIGRAIVDLALPKDTLVLLICRDGKYLVPEGSSKLAELDVLTLLQEKSRSHDVAAIFNTLPSKP